MQYGETVLVLRRLLARIRDVMAGDASAETCLGRIVAIIAADMGCEVCSIYVRRAGDVLELFATQGLRASAVHLTRLRVSEGLIGEIAATARPLALAHAQSHPNFVFRPETGEEPYQSLMGVPILRGGRVVGVVAVQNIRSRQYTDEEIEALQTVAMVLAELITSQSLISREELVPAEGIGLTPLRLEGAKINAGLGFGLAFLHHQNIVVRRLVAEDTRVEHERLRRAVSEMHGALDDMLRRSVIGGTGEHRDVLETYRMIAEDVGWLHRISEAINAGLTAEAAVQKVSDDIHGRMSQVADEYLRERVHDLEDLANRLLQHLVEPEDAKQPSPPSEDFVLIARSLGPAQLLDYHLSSLRAVVLEEGSPNSHVAIVARALDIPVIGQVRDALRRIDNGDLLVVDVDHAQVLVRPGEDVTQLFRRSLVARSERRARHAALRHLPAETVDGVRISVHVNAGLLVDVQNFADLGADGVGLYRTEVPFMIRSELPDVEAQRHLYARVLDYVQDKPVIFRTLDIGGDKVLPYWDSNQNENPAMGWRAVRIAFDRPAMQRQQLRALVRAATGRQLNVMFPMIAEVGEFRFMRRLLDAELDHHRCSERPAPTSVRVGAMLEVPSLLYQLDELLPDIDFLSIGTNDLFQFLFASDRSDYRMSERYDVLSPAALRVLKQVIDRCHAARVPVCLCGEMAGQPIEAMALIGIGIREISVSPPAVGPIKETIRSLRTRGLAEYMEWICRSPQRSVRAMLQDYARDHEIVV